MCTSIKLTPLSAICASMSTALLPPCRSAVVDPISCPWEIIQTRAGIAPALSICNDSRNRSPENTSCGDAMLSTFTGSGAVPPVGAVNTAMPRSLARRASVSACPRFSLPSLISRIRRAPSAGNVLRASCIAPSISVAIPSFGSTPSGMLNLSACSGTARRVARSANVIRRKSAPDFLRTRSRTMASPRCKDSRGMLAEVSSNTVTASFSTRMGAHGSASAIANAAKAAHFSARQAREAPGAFRIHHHRMGSNPSRSRKMG